MNCSDAPQLCSRAGLSLPLDPLLFKESYKEDLVPSREMRATGPWLAMKTVRYQPDQDTL